MRVERVPLTREARSAVAGCCRQPVWRIFLLERCGWKKQGLAGVNEWSVLQRINGKGCMCAVVKLGEAKRNRAATTWICRVEKNIDPGSEMSEKERNERMTASSCVGLALRCE